MCSIFSIVPFTTSMIPFAGNLRPRRAFTCVEIIVMATAEVNPLITGVEMKFTMKPVIIGI